MTELKRVSQLRVDELTQWIGEHGSYDHLDRPYERTRVARNMLKLNREFLDKAKTSIDMIERGYC